MNGYMVYALSASSDTKYAFFSADAWMKAIEVAVVGMFMVFAVLAILWGVLALFKVFFAPADKTKKTAKAEKTETADAAPAKKAEVVEVAPVEAPAASNDAELIAVLSAAIAAYRASEEGVQGSAINGFRVVSFKRANATRAWNSNKR